MKKYLLLLIVFATGFGTASILEEGPKALSFTADQITNDIYEGKEYKFLEPLGSKYKGATVFQSSDGQFSMGGFEMIIDENSKLENKYDPFPRNEYMYFTKGGMKLIDENGEVTEAGPGEMLFIPKGWVGTRIITGEDKLQKFSVVYYDK